MSLKQETVEIFTKYGLDATEIKVYHTYLGNPQASVSQISVMLELDYNQVLEITKKLESKNFLKKIPGIVDRYIPLEPYFELYNGQTRGFRDEITRIKNAVLADQSAKFEKIENIEATALKEISTAVKDQIDLFFKDADEQDNLKKNALMQKRTDFEKTGKELEKFIQDVTFAARDRFEKTSKDLEANLQKRLFETRDHYEQTSKALEKDLHAHLEKDFQQNKTEVDSRHNEAAAVLDKHSSKFTSDNNALNSELDKISGDHNASTKALEVALHDTLNSLNGKLKEIANSYVSDFDSGINEANTTINKIIADLLADFKDRVAKLQTEIKKDLDNHVDYHKDNSQKLKPTLDETLEKYIMRINQVIEDLKNRISKVLLTHTEQINTTTTKLKNSLSEHVENRHQKLSSQVESFRDKTVLLIDNLKVIADDYSELGEILKSRGSAWKALFLGQHKLWQQMYNDIQEKISRLSGSMKSEFENSTKVYIEETHATTKELQNEIADTTAKEYSKLKSETEALDKTQQEEISAEIRGLADSLSKEIDDTMARNIKHCQDTTVKLKDSIEKSFGTHQEDYIMAIKKHNQTSNNHYNTMNSTVKSKTQKWYSDMDLEFTKSKNGISSETEGQIKRINDHLAKTKDKNVAHSKEFEKDKEEVKAAHRKIFDQLLATVRKDIDDCKSKISGDIDSEIKKVKEDTKNADEYQHKVLDDQIALFKSEIANVDKQQHEKIDQQIAYFHAEGQKLEDSLHNMLEDHKAKYKDNATNLKEYLSTTIKDNIQNVKDAIADFTIQFMNSIDEAYEIAEKNEQKLTEIFNLSKSIVEQPFVTTWHVCGHQAILGAICDIIRKTKSSVIVVTPDPELKVIQDIGMVAMDKQRQTFGYTTQWDMSKDREVIETIKKIGNVNLKNLKAATDFYACVRDAEEFVLAPRTDKKQNLIGLVSNEENYTKLFAGIIGSTFQANSRPL
jgi:sugar-specific transcriptional regulator TrmB